jgi:thioredoxin 1
MAGTARSIGEEDFRTVVLENTKPVMVDFYAEWCGPCRLMGPVVDRLAEEWGDRVEIVKIDTEGSQGLCRELGIQALPTVMVFWAGEVLSRLVGFRGEDALRTELKRAQETAAQFSGGSRSAPERPFREGAD